MDVQDTLPTASVAKLAILKVNNYLLTPYPNTCSLNGVGGRAEISTWAHQQKATHAVTPLFERLRKETPQ